MPGMMREDTVHPHGHGLGHRRRRVGRGTGRGTVRGGRRAARHRPQRARGRPRGEPNGRAAGAHRRRGLQRAAAARRGRPGTAGPADHRRPGAARRLPRRPECGLPGVRGQRVRRPRRPGRAGRAAGPGGGGGSLGKAGAGPDALHGRHEDLMSVAISAFAAAVGATAAIERLTVIDSDPDVLAWAADQISGTGIDAELVEHDLRHPLPGGLVGGFDVACTDPPYTVAGAELFLSRAVSALAPEPGKHVFFSFGARRPDETLQVQQLIGSMGLAVRALWPNFNEYLGAGILAGTSHLYYLRSTAAAAPLVEGDATGPLYTAEARATAARPYRCAGCRAVHEVGPGGRWPRIAALQEAGCPQCGGTVFRPMPLRARTGTGTGER